jgi:hypothetical protein
VGKALFFCIPHFWRIGLLIRILIRICSVWQRYGTLATNVDTGSISSTRVFIILISAFKRLVTSRPTLLGVSASTHGVGVPTSDS